jgi:lysophospholipase L1-like esterase
MTPTHRRVRIAIVRAVVAVAAVATLAAQQTAPGHRIAVWGSSVANGTGDELRKEGYTGRLRELLAPRGWQVFNQSRGGDNTVRIAPRFEPTGQPDPQTRYLTTVNPNYVLIGLSLGNEGIAGVTTKAEKDAVYTQFETGLRNYIAKSRERHIVPIVTLCYARNDFTAVEYEYTRRMNLLINTWDVPSVNFLGAVDDGTGKWADGFWNDALHPTAAGHAELTTTFVPSLFEALERAKPLPSKPIDAGFAHVMPANGGGMLTVAVPDTMHPFTLVFSARADGDGIVATVSGKTVTATTEKAPIGRGANAPANRVITTLTAATPFVTFLSVTDGVWTYKGADGQRVASSIKADSAWHRIALTHYTARGETLFYVDGKLAGRVSERLEPARFGIGQLTADGARLQQLYLKDLLIYRAGMNADEMAALEAGTLLQASLEVYAPLNDARFEAGKSVENRAQSLTPVIVGGTIARMAAPR